MTDLTHHRYLAHLLMHAYIIKNGRYCLVKNMVFALEQMEESLNKQLN